MSVSNPLMESWALTGCRSRSLGHSAMDGVACINVYIRWSGSLDDA